MTARSGLAWVFADLASLLGTTCHCGQQLERPFRVDNQANQEWEVVATFVRPLDRREAISLWQFAGLRLIGWDFWTFIPKGDMPRWTCVILEVLDRVGRMCRWS